MGSFNTSTIVCLVAAVAVTLSGCGSEQPKVEKKAEDTPDAATEQTVAAAPAAPAPAPAAAPASTPAAPAAAPEAAPPAATPEPAPAAATPAAAPEAAPAAAIDSPEAQHAKTPEELQKAAQEGKEFKDGKWVLPDGTPTYDVITEGSGDNLIVKQVDWHTYSGWRRYHAECHVCHGPNGEGSSFAPALAESLKTMSYEKFLQVVSSGQRRNVGGTEFIMPALGDNLNVMCYIDDLYVYLKARSTGALPGGRISADQRAEKPKEAIEFEKSCLGE
jgi:methanol metabolism-related c-type cytochrome